MHFRPFPVFWAYVFLSGKSADPNPPPPLLVENSTIFFFWNLPFVNVANPKYSWIFKHILADILGPISIKTAGNSKRNVYILIIIDLVFYAVTYYILDSISSKDIRIALKTLEASYGPIKYFTSDSGPQLKESALNIKDATGKNVFTWSHSARCGPSNQHHNLIESWVGTFKRFAKIFSTTNS